MTTNRRHRQHVQRTRGLATATKCWELVVTRGLTHAQIGKELGINQGTVTRALARAEQLGLETLRQSIEGHKHRQFARLEALYVESMHGWTHSRRRDPRFLAAADRAIASIRALLGLDSPQRTQIQHAITPHPRPFADRTDDELRQELAETLALAGIDPATLTRGLKSVN
jgi:AcrR family transcriptional regulator